VYQSALDCNPKNADIRMKIKAIKEKQKRTSHMHSPKQQQRKQAQQPQQVGLATLIVYVPSKLA
jgi:hypothetical protein